mmetsp:Transcript_15067/g.52187  ORF Transcript_15067/g.52187 Transcript_15067/m.52187 type:complete len:356 (-) Transcript_15067:329-1396(-)
MVKMCPHLYAPMAVCVAMTGSTLGIRAAGPAPTPAAAKETPAPTTTPGRDGRCCWWDNYDPAGDPQCFNCQSDQERSCASSRSKCEADCGGHYCAFDEAWTAAPTPTPPVNDGGEGCECRSASEVTSDAWCWKTECAKEYVDAGFCAYKDADGVVCSGGSGGGPGAPGGGGGGTKACDKDSVGATCASGPLGVVEDAWCIAVACAEVYVTSGHCMFKCPEEAPPANTLAPTPATTTTTTPARSAGRGARPSSRSRTRSAPSSRARAGSRASRSGSARATAARRRRARATSRAACPRSRSSRRARASSTTGGTAATPRTASSSARASTCRRTSSSTGTTARTTRRATARTSATAGS